MLSLLFAMTGFFFLCSSHYSLSTKLSEGGLAWIRKFGGLWLLLLTPVYPSMVWGLYGKGSEDENTNLGGESKQERGAYITADG